MTNFDLRKYLAENKLFEAAMACPAATQNLELNTKGDFNKLSQELFDKDYDSLSSDEQAEVLSKSDRLGYCWMHHFKCHSARSCRTWAKGGPIIKDSISYDWQERNKDKV
jgi:hypothetical protein